MLDRKMWVNWGNIKGAGIVTIPAPPILSQFTLMPVPGLPRLSQITLFHNKILTGV